jgi:multidrug efflux pump subunit AcrB
MFLAVLSVSALIWLALGRREAAVVLIAIPVTFALTLFIFYCYGYTRSWMPVPCGSVRWR